MIAPMGAVFRVELEPVRTVYLCRSEALFAEVEWEWSEELAKRHVFESYEAAAERAGELRAAGEGHAHAMVIGRGEDGRDGRNGLDGRNGRDGRVSGAKCYEGLERRGLA